MMCLDTASEKTSATRPAIALIVPCAPDFSKNSRSKVTLEQS